MQAEHIPVHLGAMPAAVAAVLGEDHAPGRLVDPQRPLRGGTHLPDITVVTPVFDATASCSASPPAARHHADVGGPTPGLDAGRLDDARRGGRRHRARACSTTRRSTSSSRRCASPTQRRADLRAQLAANRVGRAAARRAGRARRRATRCARRPARSSTTPSGARAPASRELDDGDARGRRRARGARGRPRAALARDGRRRRADARLHRLAPTSTTGNLNCPLAVTRSACLFAVRVLTDPDIPPSAGAYRPIDGDRARGLAAQRALAGRGRRRQRRDLVARRRPRARRVRPRARPGHDEQPHARQRRLHLLRDARRRPGRVPGRRRPERACTSRCRNTLNTPVEALELEFPLRVVEYALRRGSGGAGRAPRRRRRRARARGARADDATR